jgi:hypothetical protein
MSTNTTLSSPEEVEERIRPYGPLLPPVPVKFQTAPEQTNCHNLHLQWLETVKVIMTLQALGQLLTMAGEETETVVSNMEILTSSDLQCTYSTLAMHYKGLHDMQERLVSIAHHRYQFYRSKLIQFCATKRVHYFVPRHIHKPDTVVPLRRYSTPRITTDVNTNKTTTTTEDTNSIAFDSRLTDMDTLMRLRQRRKEVRRLIEIENEKRKLHVQLRAKKRCTEYRHQERRQERYSIAATNDVPLIIAEEDKAYLSNPEHNSHSETEEDLLSIAGSCKF